MATIVHRDSAGWLIRFTMPELRDATTMVCVWIDCCGNMSNIRASCGSKVGVAELYRWLRHTHALACTHSGDPPRASMK